MQSGMTGCFCIHRPQVKHLGFQQKQLEAIIQKCDMLYNIGMMGNLYTEAQCEAILKWA